MASLIPNLHTVNEKIDEFYGNVVRPILQKYDQNDWYSVFVKHRELKFKNIFIGKQVLFRKLLSFPILSETILSFQKQKQLKTSIHQNSYPIS
jgi:hypothetical protein